MGSVYLYYFTVSVVKVRTSAPSHYSACVNAAAWTKNCMPADTATKGILAWWTAVKNNAQIEKNHGMACPKVIIKQNWCPCKRSKAAASLPFLDPSITAEWFHDQLRKRNVSLRAALSEQSSHAALSSHLQKWAVHVRMSKTLVNAHKSNLPLIVKQILPARQHAAITSLSLPASPCTRSPSAVSWATRW